MSIKISLLYSAFNSLDICIYPEVELQDHVDPAGSCGSSIFKTFIQFFHSNCNILPSCQQYATIPVYPHLHEYFLLVLVVRCNGHPTGWEVISHCGFDVHFSNDQRFQGLFIYLTAICISFLEKYLFWSFVNLKIRLHIFVFLLHQYHFHCMFLLALIIFLAIKMVLDIFICNIMIVGTCSR